MELNDLIASVDIVDYISQFVDLEEKNGEFWGLSCFKEEKTPSFSVRRDPPLFYDYSSGFGGNLYSFVKRYFKCSSRDAVEIIKKYAGYDGEIEGTHEKMTATMVCKRFRPKTNSKKKPAAKVIPADHMKMYEKRDDKLEVWRKEGISDESLKRFGVCYDSFSDRLVYPIRNLRGEILNVGGRTLSPTWKEDGLRKYTYFYQWGAMNVIYGLHENLSGVLKRREVIIFEGAKSVMLADSWGIRCCGAILTSHLNDAQMKILARLGCRVVFALDKDVDVRKDERISRLSRYVTVEYIEDREGLLDDKDAPVDKGVDTFLALYKSRRKLRERR